MIIEFIIGGDTGMAVIKDYMNGACHIIVHDDCIRPPDEVKRIIDRVSAIVINEEMRRHMEQKEKGLVPPTEDD